MSPEEQRIAIAEACGWTVVSGVIGECRPDKNNEPEFHPTADLPDYLSDLNACHEMEKTLDPHDIEIYVETIHQMPPILQGWQHGSTTFRKFLHATAAQRCEAFLRTKCLWKD